MRVLADGQIEDIILAALEVLAATGAQVHHERCRCLLTQAGAHVGDAGRIFLPAGLVRCCLQTVPPSVRVCDRSGRSAMQLEGRRSYFGTGSDTPFVLDIETGEPRSATLADVEMAARVADALPNIDFHMSLALARDVSASVYDRLTFAAMVRNTTKPLVVTAMDEAGLHDVLAMCYLVAGNRECFLANPFVVLYGEYTSPLVHTSAALGKLLVASQLGLPQIYTGSPLAGGTAPATFAGVLVLAVADFLVGMVLSQLTRPGTPILMGGVPSIFEMRYANISYGIEMSLLCAALSEIAHHLHIPVWSVAGCSDAKLLDQQAGLECASSVIMAALSGANLVHDVGYLDMALTGSLEMLVMSDEVISMTRRMLRGIEVNPTALAVDVIHRVGPGRQYLVEEHTLEHFRTEFWFPSLLSRETRAAWIKTGQMSLGQRVKARLQDLLSRHRPEPLPVTAERGIAAMLTRLMDTAPQCTAEVMK